MGTTTTPSKLPEPATARWTALRAGIQNVWEYDDRRFVFTRGRLLLRGQNEAGKTKALELLFPFLLDGDLAPQRLDPFGTTARPMRWNLVNDQDPEEKLRIGYVWLELGRKEGDGFAYLTIGAGLRARRSSSDVEHWFFLTSQRPDRELSLVQEGRPLARGALEEAIGAAGQVIDGRAEYRRVLNAKLFSLQPEQYTALVDTLLHLRRPQLSKSLDPDQLSGFLTEALPPLDPAVIGPIAEGFERLDHHRAELENLEATLRRLREFARVYRAYAAAVVRERADELTAAEGAFQRSRALVRERVEARVALERVVQALEDELGGLELQDRETSARITTLEDSDAFRAARELDEAERLAAEAERRAAEVARRAGADAGEAQEALALVARRSAEREERAASVGAASRRAEEAAEGALLRGAHGAVATAVTRGDCAAAEGAAAAIHAEREAALAKLRPLRSALARAEGEHQRADERARERATERAAAAEALDVAERAFEEAFRSWADDVERWQEGLVALPRGPIPELDGPAQGGAPALMRARVEALAGPLRQRLADGAAGVRGELRQLGAERSAVARECKALAQAHHPVPPVAAWRRPRPTGRAGAPLFELCEFGPGSAGAEAGIEAALEASGLLDAWVEPSGLCIETLTGELVLRGPALPGRTLADVLVPVAAGGLTLEQVRAALERVEVLGAGETSQGRCWIARDGRFRLGALEGAHEKVLPAYVGAAAREAERVRQLAALDARLSDLDRSFAERSAMLEGLEGQAARLAAEVAALPQGGDLPDRVAVAGARAGLLEEARARAAAAEAHAAGALQALTATSAELERAAAEFGIAPFAREPGRLAELSRTYEDASRALVAAARELERAESARAAAVHQAGRAEARAGESREEAARVRAGAAEVAARAAALREVSGGARDEVLRELHAAREARDALRARRDRAGKERIGASEELGAARVAVETAERDAGEADTRRKGAAERYRALGPAGLLASAGVGPAEPSTDWSFTALLEHARSALATGNDGEAGERSKLEDRLSRRYGELVVQLPPGVRLLPGRAEEAAIYDATWNGHTRPLGEVVAEMEKEAAARETLLGQEESALIERFLTGEAHDHLAARLRAAQALVARMNGALESRITSAGAQVQLAWRLDAGASAEAQEAVPLFFKGGALLSEGNRRTLRTFLEHRLVEAREADDERPLQERLGAVLDYRRWHSFEVHFREPGQRPVKLTRKAHAAGSGGRKAVMLHLPVFAAVAAFYDAAAPGAPRLIGLDEAFAGIDRPTRANLMGLLAEFDLDFVMTSFEEWGCYPQLDGLSTYHLTRERGHRGVYAEWFLWDGHERVMVEAS